MKNEMELNSDILSITLLIQEQFPELSKYITEMPVTIPDINSPDINLKMLNDYYDSLCVLFNEYAARHNSIKRQEYLLL